MMRATGAVRLATVWLVVWSIACDGGGVGAGWDGGTLDVSPSRVDAPTVVRVDGAPPPRPGYAAPAPDAPAPRDAQGSPDDGPKVATSTWSMGYYAGYDLARLPVEEIAWAGLTHVAAAFFIPKADGTLDESFYQGSQEQGRALARKLVEAAHAHGRKAVASLGGAESVSVFRGAASAARMDAFVAAIVKLATDYAFDGIDFDWEPLSDGDVVTLTDLASRVRAARPSLLLTVPVGWTNANQPPSLPGYAALSRVVDQINVMTYGAAGAWTGWKSWHSSALYQKESVTPSSVDASVRAYLAAGVPREKVGFGIGFYGLCYTSPISGPGQTLTSAGTLAPGGGALPYATILGSYYAPEARQWDAVARVPYLSFASGKGPKGCGFISYDDEQSIAEKAAYLKAQGLGGVIVWEINQGHLPASTVGSRDPLLDAIGASVLGP